MPYLIALVLVVVGGLAYYLLAGSAPVATTEPIAEELVMDETPSATDTSSPTPEPATDYKDGTYENEITYLNGARAEYLLDISLTLKDDIVTNSNIVYTKGAEKDPNAQRFEAAYKAEVIGKDIDTLNLSRVAGASLTTAAFNNALVEIKADAKS